MLKSNEGCGCMFWIIFFVLYYTIWKGGSLGDALQIVIVVVAILAIVSVFIGNSWISTQERKPKVGPKRPGLESEISWTEPRSKASKDFRGDVYLQVKEIEDDYSRIQAFRSLAHDTFVDVDVEWDKYDEIERFVVRSETGRMIGRLPKGNRKLVKSYNANPYLLARIDEHREWQDKETTEDVFYLTIQMWVGFTRQELDRKRKEIQGTVDARKNKRRLKESLAKLRKDLKESSDKEDHLDRLENITHEIFNHNQNYRSVKSADVRLPLNDLTTLTNRLGLWEKTIEYSVKYGHDPTITESQKLAIDKRVVKAQKSAYRN